MTGEVHPWNPPDDLRVRVIGPGRAGASLAAALDAAGVTVHPPLGRGQDPGDAAADADLVVVATPDPVIGAVAARIRPDPAVLVVHLAGSLGPDALGSHPRRGVLHPLVSLPDPAVGARRLADGAWFGIDADRADDRGLLAGIVSLLGGHAIGVTDDARAAYHAAAVIASNHLVALIGQVERVAAVAGVPRDAYLALARHTLDGLADAPAARMLTGPVARGDWATVRRHIDALPGVERPAYAALAEAAAVVADPRQTPPAWLAAARRGEPLPGGDRGDGGTVR